MPSTHASMDQGLEQAGISCVPSVLDLIVRTARTHPLRLAVTDGRNRLTFAELLSVADHNTRNLRSLGVAPGSCLLVSIDRGVALPLAWLTSMMLDTVFVPIDREWPAERLAHIARQTGAGFLLQADGEDSVRIDGVAGASIRIDTAELVDLASLPSVRPRSMLYGFFTSGSTGSPKCALNHHAGVANRLLYMTRRFGEGNVVLQNSAHLFDSSIWQILWPLVSGGTAVIPPERRPADVGYTVELIERHQINMTDFVPSIFRLMVRELKAGRIAPSKLASLTNVIVGGEQIDAVLVREFQAILPRIKLINTYGHTEASIGMVFHEIANPVGDTIPLGTPIDSTYVRVCDERMRPCPEGEIGEIVVGGICVGGGYLGLPELTRAVFIDNPFPDIPGKTVYRTGDLGRIGDGGLLEYHGRVDSQVKVRGVRIDLGEIEHVVMEAFEGRVEALATTYETEDGDRVIGLAYTAPTKLAPSAVIDAICRKLPKSHVPKALSQVPHIPLTPNGKADRKSLANGFRNTAPSDGGATTLDKLIDAFRAYLPNGAGADTDFFESGGDSLDAVNLTLYLERKFQITVDASAVYYKPTPRLLARWLDGSPASHPTGHTAEEPTALPVYDGPAFPAAWPEPPRHILLTGATGFVGIHLLDRLLKESDAIVSVIVRGSGVEGAVGRMHAAAAAAGIDLGGWTDRLRILPGDLSKPRLGCDLPRWEWLARTVDTIVHAGAEVNFLLTYGQLQAANVRSTEELIRLCSMGRPKRFHYISSLAARKGDALSPFDPARNLSVEQLTAAGADGYAATKVACERLLHGAAAAGLDAMIHRLDDVLPSPTTGVANKRSVIYRFFRLCYALRTAPVDVGGIAALTIDDAAGRLARAACRPGPEQPPGRPRSADVTSREIVDVTRLLRAIEQVTACPFTYLSYPAFIERLAASSDPATRLMQAVLPPPGETNAIFGPAAGDAATAWSGPYPSLAAAFAQYRFHFEE